MRTATKIICIILLSLILTFCIYISTSPYRLENHLKYKAVSQSIVIKSPVHSLFAYMGNSANAADWSVFVDHITPLNVHEVPDGNVGCQRRCFTRSDESGATWDESILIVEKDKRRRLNIYNMVDFPLTSDYLLTDQIYEMLSDSTSKLTFTLFLDEKKAGYLDQLKLHLVSRQVNDIFQRNLINIKNLNEKTL